MNPFRNPSKEQINKYLRELNNNEILDLLDLVSSDVKRRNDLMRFPSGASSSDIVHKIFQSIIKNPKNS
jgi:hypothetical protein